MQKHIARFPMRLLSVAIVLTLCLFALGGLNTWRMYSGFRDFADRDLRLVELAGSIVHLDEVLTMSARMAAVSGDSEWQDRYKKYEPLLDSEIKEVIQLAPEAYETASARATDAANLKLVEMETQAFDLVKAGKKEEAIRVLFGNEYAKQKEVYASGMSTTMASLKSRGENRIVRYSKDVLLSIIAAVFIFIFLMVCWARVIQVVGQYLKVRNAALAELEHANNTLEQRVADRTRELEGSLSELKSAQEQLVSAARATGMAEIAVGVLHNVGNVLNSVNVGAQTASDVLKGARVVNLRKAIELLKLNQGDLATFLLSDKGRRIPELMSKTVDQIDGTLENATAELHLLQSHIDHIRTIVAAQQEYARAPSHADTFSLADVVEKTVSINSVSFGKRGIELVRRFENVPELTTDKHKLMQILVNLIGNACHAVQDVDGHRRIEIVACGENEGRVRVEVRDSGIGIHPEMMEHLFRHGFTTKKDGHGFGLYSSANAATELGGSLTASSSGPGRGATFVLQIPSVMPGCKAAHAA